MTKYYFVYLMASRDNSVLYTGFTNNIIRRVHEHKEGLADGFTKKYNVKKLVYFESFDDVDMAITREKQIKAGSRAKKERLINSVNKEWKDLWDEIRG